MSPSMSPREVHDLVAALGEAPKVTYAPPNIYPMAAPDFEPAREMDRGKPPDGPIGIYAHVPYCHYKCTFCFYATTPIPAAREMERYLSAIETELAWLPPAAPLTQLYVGGGTPTALPPELLDRLLGAIFERVTPGEAVDTVECSPDSIIPEHVPVLRRHGIERISMGVQTGEEGIRDAINRRHDNRQVLEACDLLVGAGFVVNVDLIYGLPGQDEERFSRDFEFVASRGVHSVTSYNLRINEKTPIGRLVADDARLDAVALVRWREHVRAVARDAGFEQTRWHTYERREPATAAEAAGRFRDVTGWGDQLGVGVSARSRLQDTVYINHARQKTYLERVESGGSPVEKVRRLDEAERRLRFMALTLGDGRALDRAAYRESFGTEFDDDFAGPLERLDAAGIVVDDGPEVRLSDRGRLVYDLATRAFYPQAVRRWMDHRQQLAGTSNNLRPRV